MSKSVTTSSIPIMNQYCPFELIDLISFSSSMVNSSKLVTNTPYPFISEEDLTRQIATVEQWQIYLLFFGLALCAFAVAQVSKWIVKNLQRDQESMDSEFDAGRDATSGVIASTVVSYWIWAASLLQSTTVTSLYGISGAFWYAAGASIQILLFSILTVQLKIKAPGAKTYLQVIRARFDKSTHLTFCAFALLTNVVVTAMLMLGGATVLTNLVSGLSVEMSTLLVTGTVFTYTFVGGLNATMYVSYFNTTIIFALILVFLTKVFYVGGREQSAYNFGSIKYVFETVACLKGPSTNRQSSFLTMYSLQGLWFGIINVVGNFGALMIDQSYWQCGVAGKPYSAVGGFLMAGFVWFTVPFSFGSTMGMAYKSIVAVDFNRTIHWRGLSEDQISRGLVAPYVANRLLGTSGSLMCVLLIVMAVISTGASQIIAVTSVLVYDIYQIYLKPYRLVLDCNTCLLCGCEKGRKAQARSKNVCKCLSMSACKDCGKDNKVRALESNRKPVKSAFTCLSHGSYRAYGEFIQRLKNWCQVIFTIAILPLTIILNYLPISLGWVYSFMGIVIGSAVVPVVLSMSWSGLNGRAMSSGAIGGAVLGITSWLITAAMKPGGLSDFVRNTGDEVSMLVGNLVSIASGALLSVGISLVLGRSKAGESDTKETWEMTRDIDNPLRPWTELYSKELNLAPTDQLDCRPSLEAMENKYRRVKYFAIIVSVLSSLGMVILWPVVVLAEGVMDLNSFTRWIHLITVVTFVAGVFIIVLPPISEFIRIRRTLRDKNRIEDVSENAKKVPVKHGFTSGSLADYKKEESESKEVDCNDVVDENKLCKLDSVKVQLDEPQ